MSYEHCENHDHDATNGCWLCVAKHSDEFGRSDVVEALKVAEAEFLYVRTELRKSVEELREAKKLLEVVKLPAEVLDLRKALISAREGYDNIRRILDDQRRADIALKARIARAMDLLMHPSDDSE